jgi:hypothetical protein
MSLPFFKMRIAQLGRLLSELGFMRSVLVVSVLGFAIAAAFNLSSETPIAVLLAGIGGVGVLGLHLKRSDTRFVKVCFEQPIPILWMEYTIISAPILMVLLVHQHWFVALGLVFVIISISFYSLSFRKFHLNTKVQRLIPDYYFEWKAGFRRYLLQIVFVWIAGLVGSVFIGTVPIAIFILGYLVISFQENFEALPILIADENGPKKFMRKKMVRHVLLFATLIAPLICAFVAFHPTQFYIPIILFLLLALLVAYTIALKYAFYEPASGKGVGQTLISIGFLGAVFPFFTPVIILMTIRYYLKAKTNLKQYLHDFD